MKITLTVNGQEMTFSKEELTSILEQNSKETLAILKQNSNNQIIETPTIEMEPTSPICVCFDVNPNSINQALFQEERDDPSQEKTRKIILEAFAELKNNPEKYAKPFQSVWLKKTWNYKTVEELEYLAKNVGDHMTDWVEQSLEWAQRIANCDAWQYIYNVPYADQWAWQVIYSYPSVNEMYRLVRWKNGEPIFVSSGWDDYSHSYVGSTTHDFLFDGCYYSIDRRLYYAVPSIVRYK